MPLALPQKMPVPQKCFEPRQKRLVALWQMMSVLLIPPEPRQKMRLALSQRIREPLRLPQPGKKRPALLRCFEPRRKRLVALS